jgi:hypothetical protein
MTYSSIPACRKILRIWFLPVNAVGSSYMLHFVGAQGTSMDRHVTGAGRSSPQRGRDVQQLVLGRLHDRVVLDAAKSRLSHASIQQQSA